MKLRLLVLLILLTVFVSGGVAAQDAPIRVLATTTILADVAQNVAGDLFTVDTLVPADADTHAFEPSTADVARVAEADLLLVVGAGYEAFLGDLLENAGSEAAEVITVSNGVEILGFSSEHDHEHEGEEHADEADPMATEEAHSEEEHEHEHEGEAHIGVLGVDAECDVHEHEGEEAEHSEEGEEGHEHEHGECDAHVWTDPMNGVIWANNIADAFSAADAANAAAYRANADAYIAQLEAVDAEIETLVAGIPEARRILVTNHEFMGYFAYAYGFEVVGTVLPGATTDAEPNPQELADLIALVQEEGVPAIFAEVSANPQLAEVVAEEAGIAVVTTLYSESLSGSDGPASTYLDYLRYNAQIIAQALSN